MPFYSRKDILGLRVGIKPEVLTIGIRKVRFAAFSNPIRTLHKDEQNASVSFSQETRVLAECISKLFPIILLKNA